MKVSEYLIGNGWLPSPTIDSEGAWEHGVYSVVPKTVTDNQNLYFSGWRRIFTQQAFSIQLLMEAMEHHKLKGELSYLNNIMKNFASFCGKLT